MPFATQAMVIQNLFQTDEQMITQAKWLIGLSASDRAKNKQNQQQKMLNDEYGIFLTH